MLICFCGQTLIELEVGTAISVASGEKGAARRVKRNRSRFLGWAPISSSGYPPQHNNQAGPRPNLSDEERQLDHAPGHHLQGTPSGRCFPCRGDPLTELRLCRHQRPVRRPSGKPSGRGARRSAPILRRPCHAPQPSLV